ncbi:MAG: hypothetical protein V3R34_01735 [Hyphomicrobium sp.]
MSDPNIEGKDRHGEGWGIGQCDELALAVYSENPILELDLEGAEQFYNAFSDEFLKLETRTRSARREARRAARDAKLASLSKKDIANVAKAVKQPRPATVRAAGLTAMTLVGSLAHAFNRKDWSKTLERWQTKEGEHNLDVGLASTSKPRPVAHDPDEILKLAKKLQKKPTPYAVGALLGAVLDVAATIQGDKPA